LRRAEGGAKNFGVFRVKNHDFTPKNHIFSNFRGGARRVRPPLNPPLLLYGCETWGFGKNDIIERVHLKFCKLLLHVKTSTPNFMVYGELSRYPIDIDIKVRMISYWSKLILGNQ
jgi:hypothetical protein